MYFRQVHVLACTISQNSRVERPRASLTFTLEKYFKDIMSKFYDYFALIRYSRTSLATSSRKRSPIQNSARVSLFWVSTGFNELLEFVGYFP